MEGKLSKSLPNVFLYAVTISDDSFIVGESMGLICSNRVE